MIMFSIFENTSLYIPAVLMIFAVLCRPSLAAAPNPIHPVNIGEITTRGQLGSGFGWNKVLWDLSYTPEEVKKAQAVNEKAKERGLVVDAGLMQWVGASYEDARKRSGQEAWAKGYVDWIDAREPYLARRRDGSLVVKGWVSPAMPLNEKDWPAGVKNATFADWTAERLTDFTRAAGINGFSLADGWNGLPDVTALEQDFNPRVMAAFAEKHRLSLPDGTLQERAEYIREHYPSEWTDYMNAAWGHWMGRLVDLHRRKTGGEDLLIVFQTAHQGVGYDRGRGVDHRWLLRYADPRHFLGRIELQAEPQRSLKQMALAAPRMALFAAREPSFPTAVQISSPQNGVDPIRYDPKEIMSQAIDKRSGIDFADEAGKSLFMYRFVKQHWFGVMWAHCATRDGGLRRAVMSWSGNHSNQGRAPKAVYDLVQARYPAAPFGPALYYSVSVEKSLEKEQKYWRFDWDIEKFAAQGFVPVYAVSDTAIDRLKFAPTAFISDEIDRISPEERKKVEAIAPLYDHNVGIDKIPLPVRVQGATGFAFVDQNKKTVIVAARPMSQWKDRIRGEVTVEFSGIKDGVYRARDLIDYDKEFTITVKGGKGAFSFPLERSGDCRVFESDIPTPNRYTGVVEPI